MEELEFRTDFDSLRRDLLSSCALPQYVFIVNLYYYFVYNCYYL